MRSKTTRPPTADPMPDNANYFIAAYVALSALYAGYTLSLILRRRAIAARRARQARHAGGRT